GGIPRFRQESVSAYLHELEALRGDGIRVGVAPHSVRACPADALRELGRYATEHRLPLHVHADEQPREIDECVAEHGVRPIELLAREGCLGPRTTVVHATHARSEEHTSELQSRSDLVCRLLLEKKKHLIPNYINDRVMLAQCALTSPS